MKKQLLIALILLVSLVAACDNNGEETFSGEFVGEAGIPDLGGFDMELIYYEYINDADGVFSYYMGTEFNDLALKRIKETEEAFNCKVTFKYAGSGSFDSNFTPTLLSGQYFSDAIMSGSYELRQWARSNSFEPISSVSDILNYKDSEKWGAPNLLEWMIWDDELYGVVPVKWPEFCLTSYGHMFAFNEKFASEAGQPDPREYVEAGTWNREKLGEMMSTYTYNDGGSEIKALGGYSGHFLDQALRSNNAQPYKLVDGTYVSGYHTPEGLDALTWANDFLYTTYKDCHLFIPNDEENYVNFINEKVAMLITYVGYIYGAQATLSYTIDDYGLLPFPNGPERANEGYTGTLESVRNTLCFPLNGKDVTASAIIVNELFNTLGSYDAEGLKEYYLRYYFHDIRDYNVFTEIIENTRYSYYADGFRQDVVEALLSPKNSVASVLDSTKEMYDERVSQFVLPTVQYLDGIFN